MRLASLAIGAALLCLVFGVDAAAAERTAAPAAAAVAMTPQDRQKLVDDISNAVIAKMGRQKSAAAAAAPAQPDFPGMSRDDSLMRSGDRMSQGAMAIAAGLPDIAAKAMRLHRALVEAGADRPAWLSPEPMVLYALLLCLLAERLILLGFAGIRRRLAAEPPGLHRGVRLVATDIAGVAAFAIVAMLLAHLWFAGDGIAARTGVTVLDGALIWRGWMVAVDIVLRPGLAAARLAPLDDRAARRAKFTVSALLLATMLALRAALALGGIDSIICVTLALVLFALALLRLRRAVGSMFLGPHRDDPAAAGIVRATLARRWYEIALVVLLALYVAFLAAALLGELSYYVALVRSLEIGLLLWGFETLCGKALAGLRRRAEASGEDLTAAVVGLRLLRVAGRIGVLTWLARLWIVRTMPIAGLDTGRLGHSIIIAGATLFLAYVLWEVLRSAIERHLGATAPRRPGDEDEAGGLATSRLHTIMPLLRIGLAVGLFTVTALVVASQLGIDTAPLIAGAGVLGLAISFGSQALVRDIVSGIFFIADDAFRVGEYVDTGRLKGTVEGMTIRSLRLRHQNGQLHTIPFGQLGAVTNFSRDWTTVKFNLRLARDTDIEQLRKAVKKLGVELMEDPELAPQIIEPLKLQGLSEVADNALIVRLKFTSLPANSSWVQRTYLRHLYERLPASGIGFASNVVAVQTVGASPPEPATAGGAALSVVPPPEAAAG